MFVKPELRETGKQNFHEAVGKHGANPNRREFMKGLLAAGAVLPISAAMYYGYHLFDGEPIKAGVIGCGDEGGVLVGEHNPNYLQIVAVSDIRPYNLDRIYRGEGRSPRWGLEYKYGSNARLEIQYYEDYNKLLERKDIQAVLIATPLHSHYQITMDALEAGKHVLCEKLMAWNIEQCKAMITKAREKDRILSIGHQRHYSLLYAQAADVIRAGDVGDIKHIRALWHRNNTWPRNDDKTFEPTKDNTGNIILRDGWKPEIRPEDAKHANLVNNLRKHNYRSLEELVRWRLFLRTGGGLMAELGSHQLDACSIFLRQLYPANFKGKVRPLAVQATGGKWFYKDNREVEDHVFCTFEFPGKKYFKMDNDGNPLDEIDDKNDIVVVNYSSINSNTFEPYGECVMGTRGTMVVEGEQTVMLYPERDPNPPKPKSSDKPTNVTVGRVGAGQTAVDAQATTGFNPALAQARGRDSLPTVSRGYREEMDHFAYCVKMWEDKDVKKEDRPWVRCHGDIAMTDAIIALTANVAIRGGGVHGPGPTRITFDSKWFRADRPEVPDAHMKAELA
jgi:predicted dehydrogenase